MIPTVKRYMFVPCIIGTRSPPSLTGGCRHAVSMMYSVCLSGYTQYVLNHRGPQRREDFLIRRMTVWRRQRVSVVRARLSSSRWCVHPVVHLAHARLPTPKASSVHVADRQPRLTDRMQLNYYAPEGTGRYRPSVMLVQERRR